MATSARKQREVKERERHLLDVARGMLIAQGYSGLSMDRLAEATEFSKGTIYQHFAAGRVQKPAQHLQSGGLAGSVRTQKADDLTLCHLE